jgi:hypothetical protein
MNKYDYIYDVSPTRQQQQKATPTLANPPHGMTPTRLTSSSMGDPINTDKLLQLDLRQRELSIN